MRVDLDINIRLILISMYNKSTIQLNLFFFFFLVSSSNQKHLKFVNSKFMHTFSQPPAVANQISIDINNNGVTRA